MTGKKGAAADSHLVIFSPLRHLSSPHLFVLFPLLSEHCIGLVCYTVQSTSSWQCTNPSVPRHHNMLSSRHQSSWLLLASLSVCLILLYQQDPSQQSERLLHTNRLQPFNAYDAICPNKWNMPWLSDLLQHFASSLVDAHLPTFCGPLALFGLVAGILV